LVLAVASRLFAQGEDQSPSTRGAATVKRLLETAYVCGAIKAVKLSPHSTDDIKGLMGMLQGFLGCEDIEEALELGESPKILVVPNPGTDQNR
jgi:hypothetical protein